MCFFLCFFGGLDIQLNPPCTSTCVCVRSGLRFEHSLDAGEPGRASEAHRWPLLCHPVITPVPEHKGHFQGLGLCYTGIEDGVVEVAAPPSSTLILRWWWWCCQPAAVEPNPGVLCVIDRKRRRCRTQCRSVRWGAHRGTSLAPPSD